jgi:hypothetical protein
MIEGGSNNNSMKQEHVPSYQGDFDGAEKYLKRAHRLGEKLLFKGGDFSKTDIQKAC